MQLLVITPRKDEVSGFADALARETGLEAGFAADWPAALAAVRRTPPKLVVIDEGLAEGAPLTLAKKLLEVDPMANTAVVTPLPIGEFHAASEGLGLLAGVPERPKAADAAALAEAYRRLL